jgi:hypothetical protein
VNHAVSLVAAAGEQTATNPRSVVAVEKAGAKSLPVCQRFVAISSDSAAIRAQLRVPDMKKGGPADPPFINPLAT